MKTITFTNDVNKKFNRSKFFSKKLDLVSSVDLMTYGFQYAINKIENADMQFETEFATKYS